MKKLFPVLAVALVFCFAACNKDDEPTADNSNPYFTIKITEIQSLGCDFTITCDDNSIEWMCYTIKKDDYKNNGLTAAVRAKLNAEVEYYGGLEAAYTGLKEDGDIHHNQGTYDGSSALSSETEYALCVFQIDDKLNIVGTIAAKTFTTLPQYFSDLGLASGTVWRQYELDGTDNNPLMLTYEEAKQKGTIPTKAQWEELLSKCQWNRKQDAYGDYVQLKSAINDMIINLYTIGNYDANGNSVTSGGEARAYYWSSSAVKDKPSQNYVFYFTPTEIGITTMPRTAKLGLEPVKKVAR